MRFVFRFFFMNIAVIHCNTLLFGFPNSLHVSQWLKSETILCQFRNPKKTIRSKKMASQAVQMMGFQGQDFFQKMAGFICWAFGSTWILGKSSTQHAWIKGDMLVPRVIPLNLTHKISYVCPCFPGSSNFLVRTWATASLPKIWPVENRKSNHAGGLAVGLTGHATQPLSVLRYDRKLS